MHFALTALILSPLVVQDPGVRVPVTPDDPVVVEMPHEPPTTRGELAAGTRVLTYELAHLTGHDRARASETTFRDSSDPNVAGTALRVLGYQRGRRERARETADSLVRSIRDMIEPRLESGIQAVDHLDDGRVVLIGTPKQHEWMAQFIEATEGFDGTIHVHAHVFVLERGRLAAYTPERSGAVMPEADATQLLKDLEDSGAAVVHTPHILTRPFQKAELSVIDQQAYIKDYELKVLPDSNQEIADPIIDIVQSGLVMGIRGIPLADEDLSVQANLEYSVVESPIPTTEISIGAGHHKVTVQVPKVTRIKLDGLFTVKSGETLLLASSDPTGQNEVIVLVRTTRQVLPDDPIEGER